MLKGNVRRQRRERKREQPEGGGAAGEGEVTESSEVKYILLMLSLK